MKITKIEQAKRRKNRINVFIDGEFSFACMKNCIVDLDLYRERELTDAELEKIKKKAVFGDAREYLFNIISRKTYSERELRRKLIFRKTDSEFIDELINKMKELGLVNDERMRTDYADYLISQNKYSKNEIILKLKKKMLFDENDEELKEKLSIADDTEVIRMIMKKRIEKNNDAKKNIEFFLRRGFRYEDVSEVLKEFKKELKWHHY